MFLALCRIGVSKFKKSGRQVQVATSYDKIKNRDSYIAAIRSVKPLTADSPLRLAYNTALDIRKFEIELYWKRSAYFWAVIAATLAAYGALTAVSLKGGDASSAPSANMVLLYQVILLILAFMGAVFSRGWSYVNKGSKFWQSNWETQVELLEDEVVGPLYKTVLSRHSDEKTALLDEIRKDMSKSQSESADLLKRKGRKRGLLEKIYSPTRVNQFFSELFFYIFTILFLCTSLIVMFPVFGASIGCTGTLEKCLAAHDNLVRSLSVAFLSIAFISCIVLLWRKAKTTTAFVGHWNISIRSAHIVENLNDVLGAGKNSTSADTQNSSQSGS